MGGERLKAEHNRSGIPRGSLPERRREAAVDLDCGYGSHVRDDTGELRMALEGKFAGERVCPDWRSGRQAIWTMLEEGMKREIGEPVVHIGDAELWNSSRSGQLLRCGLDGLATYRRILSSRQAIQDPPVLSLTALYRIKPREAIKSSL